MSERGPKHYFEDPSSDSSGTDNPSGDGSSSGESVFPDAPARAKRLRISAITTRSSTRATVPTIQTQDASSPPSPALPVVQPSPHVPDVGTSVLVDRAGISLVDTAAMTTPTDSTDRQPLNTPVDAMDVDRFPDEDALRANTRAPSDTPTETEDTETETEVIPTVITEAASATVPKVNITGTEPVIKPTPVVDTPFVTTMVAPPLVLSSVIDPAKVPAFLRSHGKGNRRVDIFEYLDKLRDPHFRRILFYYIRFEANDKSGAGGSLPTGGRPAEISQWTSRAHPASLPDYTKGKRTFSMFVDSVCTWWGSLQPQWRSFARGVVSHDIHGGWDVLHAPRINGLLNIVILAFWWAQFLEEQNPEGGIRAEYEFFANDVAWVFSHLST